MDDSIAVSVVVPTLNAGAQFSELLDAVNAQEGPYDLELIVIDSGSRDGTRNLARKFGAEVLSIPRFRFNHGRARNRAIEAARGEFIVLTVQDAIPMGVRWVRDLLAPLLENDEVAGSYGVQVAPPWSGVAARARSSAWRRSNGGHIVQRIESEQAFQAMSPEDRLAMVRFDNVTSCIRRAVWRRSPFPEDRYGEDMAWTKEVVLEGHSVVRVNSAQVWHYHERGWAYRLRRAYLDGFLRVKLVEWPSPDLQLGDVYAGLRQMQSQLVKEELESLTDPPMIQGFLRQEIRDCESQPDGAPPRMYRAALDFSWGLLENALEYCPQGVLPEGVWADLFRSAIVSEVGSEIGRTVAARLNDKPSFSQAPWWLLHAAFCRGV